VPLYKLDEDGKPTDQYSHEARYLRLHIENTGLSSIRDCCGLITKITKHTADKGQIIRPQEVIYLGWSHYPESKTRDIPRGAYFYMDIVTVELLSSERRKLRLSTAFPATLINFFNDEKATYEFKLLIAADNAKPQRDITVTFKYDPKSDDLRITPVDATRAVAKISQAEARGDVGLTFYAPVGKLSPHLRSNLHDKGQRRLADVDRPKKPARYF
jgi:hypothetical protein